GGLPDWEHDKLGRVGIGIAPSNSKRIYAMVDSPTKGGVYRSDDAGASWKRVNDEARVWGRGSDFAWVRVSPKEENTIYVANTSSYKSTDGGQNFVAWKGAPGGDDYHTIWINPKNPDIILLGVDQGATITVNGGRTWSSWYNQPTAQLYHVITNDGKSWERISDDLSRPDPGTPANLGMFADSDSQKGKHRGVIYSIAPSPLDANLIWAGTDDGLLHVTHDGGTKWQNVTPPELTPWSKVAQLDASYFDAETVYAAVNRFRLDDLHPYIYRTHDGGKSWQKIVDRLPDTAPVNVVRE